MIIVDEGWVGQDEVEVWEFLNKPDFCDKNSFISCISISFYICTMMQWAMDMDEECMMLWPAGIWGIWLTNVWCCGLFGIRGSLVKICDAVDCWDTRIIGEDTWCSGLLGYNDHWWRCMMLWPSGIQRSLVSMRDAVACWYIRIIGEDVWCCGLLGYKDHWWRCMMLWPAGIQGSLVRMRDAVACWDTRIIGEDAWCCGLL